MEMDTDTMQRINDALIITISIIVLIGVIVLAKNFRPGRLLVRTYERVNNQLMERKSRFFDYEKIQGFLESHGAAQHYGKWLNPTSYIVLRIILALMCLSIGIRINTIAGVVCLIIGYSLPWLSLVLMNRSDNEKMMSEIVKVYEVLRVQIQAGVHVTAAISECYESLEKGRLKSALEVLSAEIFMKASFEDALINFNNKFSNDFIDSLCSILLQAQESGKVVELLKDVVKQIDYMEDSLYSKRKESLDRTTTLYIIAVLFVIIAVPVGMGVTYILNLSWGF